MGVFQTFLFSFFLVPSMGFAEPSSEPQGFLQGVKAYQDKDYKKAQSIFASLLDKHPNNPNLLFNLGLSEFHLGRPGLALGLWRKARSIDRNFSPAHAAVDYARDRLFPNQKTSSLLYSLYDWLTQGSPHFWIFLFMISLFGFGWFAIEYSIQWKRSPLRWPPWIHALLISTIFSGWVCLVLIMDQNRIKATVIKKDSPGFAGPSTEFPNLFELQQGQQVRVTKFHGDWIQVRSGSFSGWVPKSNLILFGRIDKIPPSP